MGHKNPRFSPSAVSKMEFSLRMTVVFFVYDEGHCGFSIMHLNFQQFRRLQGAEDMSIVEP
jgi:hypothetical protein